MDYSFQDLIRHMLATSGKTAAQVSRELGKTSGYLAVLLADGRTPRTDLLVKIANACGYHVTVQGWGDLESWELYNDNGNLAVEKEYGIEDMDEISRKDETAREAMKSLGKQELIDSLIDYLQSLKEQPAGD